MTRACSLAFLFVCACGHDAHVTDGATHDTADAAVPMDGAMALDMTSGDASSGTLHASACSSGGHVLFARDHLASWGANVDVSASNATTNAEELNTIGVRRIRTALVQGAQSNLAAWQALAAAMKSYAKPKLSFDDLVIAYNNDPKTTWDVQQPLIIAAAQTGLLTSIEGPNEMNNIDVGEGSHGVNATKDLTSAWAGASGNVFAWASAIQTWKSGLTGAQATALQGMDVLAPTISSGLQSDYAMLPDLSALVDFGNVHYYSGNGDSPSLEQGSDNPGVGYFANIYKWCRAAQVPPQNDSLVISECGATTPGGGDYTEHAQAAYLLDQLHDAAGIGAAWFHIYALVDAQTGQSGGTEGNFGLFHTDGTPKPIATALAAVKSLMSRGNDYDGADNATDTSPFTPSYDGCAITVSGIGDAGFSSRVADAVAYPRSDGVTVVSVTNEPALTDGSGNDVAPKPVTATVDLHEVHAWRVYDPLSGTPLSAQSSGSGSIVSLTLRGYPMYILVE